MSNDDSISWKSMPPQGIEIPQVARYWPPKAMVCVMNRVGPKCRVTWLPDEEGQWLEAGAVIPPSSGVQDTRDAAPSGGVGLDTAQARIYFRLEGKEQKPVCRIVLPDDFHFRGSRMGMVKGRSKSFLEDGNPVPEVRLLYALKTGDHDDRLRSVEAFPSETWGAETLGQMFSAMDDAARSEHHFRLFAGEYLARSASQAKGLADWNLWEAVADTAAENKRDRLKRAKLKEDKLNISLFVRAVKETAIENQGLPAQLHVRKRWAKLGGMGEWKEIRKTLGFKWLPSERDWKKSWLSSGHG